MSSCMGTIRKTEGLSSFRGDDRTLGFIKDKTRAFFQRLFGPILVE
jgi:hypothetical protein